MTAAEDHRYLLLMTHTGLAGRVEQAVVRRVAALAFVFIAITASAWAEVSGTAVTYKSPAGLQEQCVVLARMPSGVYSDSDRHEETAFCAIDFYSGDHALCPKVFSTSPATLVYDISRGDFAGDADAFESTQCMQHGHVKRGALGEPIAFKMTMNDRHTSATFSTASLLYYHFSRYFDTAIHVPVSVYRSMDPKHHHVRVARRGVELSAGRGSSAMNHAGWQILERAERDPTTYSATSELFTADRSAIYGVLLQPQGDRYGPEFNGTRRSGWGDGQNRDFQETAPFVALRADKPLLEATDDGIRAAEADPVLREAMRSGVAPEQMVYWMQELIEITLLDYLFSQQDRIGNIDYLNYWYWHDDGTVRRRPASGTRVPEDLEEHHPVRLRRTMLNDNDAGARVPYANFTKKTQMLEKIRHYNAETYRQLLRLAADFEAQGELYRYVRETFGLSGRQFKQIVENTRSATAIIAGNCRAGRLRFDLDPDKFLATGDSKEQKVDCDQP